MKEEGQISSLKISLLMTQVKGSWGWVAADSSIHCANLSQIREKSIKLIKGVGRMAQGQVSRPPMCWSTLDSSLLSVCPAWSCVYLTLIWFLRKFPKRKRNWFSNDKNAKKGRKNAYLFLEIGCGGSFEFAQNTQGEVLLILELSYSNSKLFLFPLTTMSFHKQQKLG